MTEPDPGSRYVAVRVEVVASAIGRALGQIQRAYWGVRHIGNGKLREGYPNIDVMTQKRGF